MQILRFTIFPETTTHYELRFIDESQQVIHRRAITAQALSEFIRDTQERYQQGIRLEALGKDLFAWLQGPESFLKGFHQNTLLQVTRSHDLENIAWELLHHNGHYLCANQHHPFTPIRLSVPTKAALVRLIVPCAYCLWQAPQKIFSLCLNLKRKKA